MTMILNSLRVRLVVGQVALFVLFSIIAYLLLDRSLNNILMARVDSELETHLLLLAEEFIDLSEQNRELMEQHLTQFSYASGTSESFFRILDDQGIEIIASDLSYWPQVATRELPLDAIDRSPFHWETMQAVGAEEQDVRAIYYRSPNQNIYQFGRSLTTVQSLIQKTRLGFGLTLLAIVAGGALMSSGLIFHSLRSVLQVTRAAVAVREKGDLSQRVSPDFGIAEADELAATFNDMMQRIETLVANVKYMSNTIAHDIRSPVARMRGLAESVASGQQSSDSLTIAGVVVEQCDHILDLVNTLLEITAAESGIRQWDLNDVDLAAEAHNALDLLEPLLEGSGIRVSEAFDQAAPVRSDRRAVQRVIFNLLDNAIKYAPTSHGLIEVGVTDRGDMSELSVKDNGPGIKSTDQPHVFERFYRGDRSRSQPGNGLGLSFCKATIEALGGQIGFTSDHRGSLFWIALPHTLSTIADDSVTRSESSIPLSENA